MTLEADENILCASRLHGHLVECRTSNPKVIEPKRAPRIFVSQVPVVQCQVSAASVKTSYTEVIDLLCITCCNCE